MKSDRLILAFLGVAGLLAAFWFLALAPKREQASKLESSIAALESDVAAQEEIVAMGRQAQADYQQNFSSLIVLGKAAPTDGDMPGLLAQLTEISEEAKVDFDALELGAAPAAAEAPAPVPPPAEAAAPPPEGAAPPAQQAATVSAIPATEAAASSLPIGASVGSAGLAVLAYDVSFSGDFFQVADLLDGIDEMIESEAAKVDVGGRLITVNNFTMTKSDPASPLEVKLSISSYALPDSQGLTAGGTSTMPPPSVPEAVPVTETAP